MELIELNVEARQNKGKGAARSLRRDNTIPAIIYGPKTDPLMISVKKPGFERIIREYGSSGLFLKLAVDGDSKSPRTVVLKEMQMDPFKLKYLHLDFHEIDMDSEVNVMVPVVTTGKSKGEEAGGLVQVIRRELEVLCKPADVPDEIIIDITDLEVGDVVHVEDIDAGENVTIPHDVNFTVMLIAAPTKSTDEEEGEEDELLEDGEAYAEADAETEAASE